MESREEFPTDSDARRAAEEIKDQARGLGQQARETGGRFAGRAREQANKVVGERKDKAAHSLDALSGALRDSAGRLRDEQTVFGDYAESAAERVERLARYLRERDPERLLEDAEDFARSRPEIFVGGMFVAGLLLARFLKSSAERAEGQGGSWRYRSGRRGPDASFQQESGSYAGSPGAGVPGIGQVGTGSYNPRHSPDIAPDDESGLGI